MKVHELIWPQDRVDHIAAHGIEPEEIEELARFWDTHDLTDFEDQLEIVAEPVFERQTTTILVRMQSQEIEAVKRIAKSKGIEYDALIRGWVLEKLQYANQ
jgi:predicted DNA binding CopG/RHH family protein